MINIPVWLTNTDYLHSTYSMVSALCVHSTNLFLNHPSSSEKAISHVLYTLKHRKKSVPSKYLPGRQMKLEFLFLLVCIYFMFFCHLLNCLFLIIVLSPTGVFVGFVSVQMSYSEHSCFVSNSWGICLFITYSFWYMNFFK